MENSLRQKLNDLLNKRAKLDITLSKSLPKSILQEAIQGKLVPQIAEEGTAKELLTQIKAEKQKLVKEGKLKIRNSYCVFDHLNKMCRDAICLPHQMLDESFFTAKKRMAGIVSFFTKSALPNSPVFCCFMGNKALKAPFGSPKVGETCGFGVHSISRKGPAGIYFYKKRRVFDSRKRAKKQVLSSNGALLRSQRGARCVATAAPLQCNSGPVAGPGRPFCFSERRPSWRDDS